jgi:hypothetical protein
MDRDSCHNVLRAEGFRHIGRLDWDLPVDLWWHTERRLEVAVVQVDRWALVRGTKHYRLTAIGEAGELYVRDLAAFDADLTTRFGEVHMVLSTFPDITTHLARKRIAEKEHRVVGGKGEPGAEDTHHHVEQLGDEIASAQDDLRRDEALLSLDRGRSDLLKRSLGRRVTRTRRQLQALDHDRKQAAGVLRAEQQLEKEYMRKGAATVLQFTVSSNVQVVEEKAEFRNAVRAVVKELHDMHRFQIRQKLQGGRLQIFVEEVEAPGVAFVTHWTGAALCPRQLDRLGSEFGPLREAVEEQYMVFPRHDIVLGGAVKDEKKLVAARVVQNFLKRLGKTPAARADADHSPKGELPVWIGNLQDRGGRIGHPWELPLDRTNHTFVSGRTGSGKSFLVRAVVEGAAGFGGVAVVILDPRDQWIGLLCPEDRPEVLDRYGRFGLRADQARSFGFTYHGVARGIGSPLPRDLRQVARGRHIVSFKGMADASRCNLAADILDAVFEACAVSESERPRVLVGVEEATRFIRRGVDMDARETAERSERSIDRVAREGRKYGMFLVLVGQSCRDFSHAMATVRQNISTRIFLANTDREIEVAAQHLDNSRAIAHLATGEAFVCNPEWGAVRLAVRPPLSKVWEPPEREARRLVEDTDRSRPRLSETAQQVLDEAAALYAETNAPVRMSVIVRRLGITSRRKIQKVIADLRRMGAARFERLKERGQPLVLVPQPETDAYETGRNPFETSGGAADGQCNR